MPRALVVVLLFLGGCLMSVPDIDDVYPMQGDAAQPGNKADRWGARYLLEHGTPGTPPTIAGARVGRQTFVDSRLFEVPTLFYIQVKFASVLTAVGGTPAPALPFQSFSSDRIQFTVRRQLDDFGGLITDTYIVNGFTPTTGEPMWFPVAVVSARKLQILAEDIDTAPGHGSQYVDVVATPVTSLDDQLVIAERDDLVGQNVFGYSHTRGGFRTAASAVPVLLLPADASRRQFFISNEGSTRLALSFDQNNPPNVGAGTESWTVILDAKGGANSRYVSPMDSYWGPVEGVWEGVPTGFAMADGSTVE